jgi:hypothetical protein
LAGSERANDMPRSTHTESAAALHIGFYSKAVVSPGGGLVARAA